MIVKLVDKIPKKDPLQKTKDTYTYIFSDAMRWTPTANDIEGTWAYYIYNTRGSLNYDS